MDCDKECPICYVKYGKQEDGEFVCGDGKWNSDMSDLCKHSICVKCCKILRNKFIEDEDEDEEKKVRCPLCREDWTYWIESHYYTTDEESDEETDEETDDESEDETDDESEVF